MPTNDVATGVDASIEMDRLRAERDEYRSLLYAELWKSVSLPTEEELASAEPLGPWFDELLVRLDPSRGK